MPRPRTELTAASGPDGRIYAIGGSFGASLDLVEAFNPSTNSWSRVADMPGQAPGGGTPPGLMQLAAATGQDGHIYALGGTYFNLGVPCGSGCASSTLAYDASTNTWAARAAMGTSAAPLGRAGLAAAPGPAGDERIYAMGGVGSFGTNPPGGATAVVQAYAPSTNTWTNLADLPTPRVHLAAATGSDGRIYAIGGAGCSMNAINQCPAAPLSVVEAYTPATNTWTTVAPLPTPRHSLAAVTGPDGRIYAIGGTETSGIGSSGSGVVEAYHPGTNTWTRVASLPTPRSALAAALGHDGLIYTMGGWVAGQEVPTAEAFTLPPQTWPGPPTSLKADPQVLAAQVSWSAPAVTGGSPITGYDISISDGVNPAQTTHVDAATLSTRFGGLTAGKPYAISVVARNAGGPGIPAGTGVTPKPQPPRQIMFVHGFKMNFSDVQTGVDPGFQTLLKALRSEYGRDNVHIFSYYQDLGYQLFDPSTGDLSGCSPKMPQPDTNTAPLFAHPDSINPNVCDSQGAIAYNATKLDDDLKDLDQQVNNGDPSHPSHTALIAYSMGGATTRGWLRLAQSRPQDQALASVDTVIFQQAVHQGSYLASAGQFINSVSSLLTPVAQWLVDRAIALVGFDLARPAAQDLAADSPWLEAVSAAPVPPQLHYFNIYSEIQVTVHAQFLFLKGPDAPPSSLGDLIILPGSDAPRDLPALGGARFLPGPSSRTADRHEYPLRSTHSFAVPLPDPVTGLIAGVQDLAELGGVVNDQRMHLGLALHLNDGSVLLDTCKGTGQVTPQQEMLRILRDPAHACD